MPSLSQAPMLPFPPDKDDFQTALVLRLEELFRTVYADIAQGTSQFKVLTAPPSTTEIEEGQIIMVDTGAARAFYTKLNGSVRTVTLT